MKKVLTAKKDLSGVLDNVNKTLTKLTAQNDASPDEVAAALTEAVVPALEKTMSIVESVVNALPTEGDAIDMGIIGNGEDNDNNNGNDNEKIGNGEIEIVDDDDDDDDNPLTGKTKTRTGTQDGEPNTDEEDADKQMKEQMASIINENIIMKKATLAQRWASTFPGNMRKAAEDEFLEENKEEEDLDKLEAKVSSAEKVVKSYLDANMINKARGGIHTAKYEKPIQRTASGKNTLDWRLRQ